MPTSSQARILQREEIYLQHGLLSARCPNPPRTSEGSTSAREGAGATAAACFIRPNQALSLPHIFKTISTVASTVSGGGIPGVVMDSQPFVGSSHESHRRLPSLERRVPHLISYPSEFQNGSFTQRMIPACQLCPDVSNNWPGDVERNLPSNPDQSQTSEEPKTESDRKHPAGEKHRRNTGHGRRKSSAAHGEHRRGSNYTGEHRRGSNFAGEHRRGSNFAGEHRRVSQMAGSSRGRKMPHSTRQSDDNPDSSSHSTSCHLNAPQESLEVNVLTLATDDDEEEKESGLATVPEPTSEPEPETEESKPKVTLKSLYKQLLTIGMSANAFRGVVVETDEGEVKNATEKEAEDALTRLAGGMVGGEEEGGEGSSESEDEDVELVMGSLLSNVGDRGLLQIDAKKPSKPADKTRGGRTPEKKPLDWGLDIPEMKTAKSAAGTGALKGFNLDELAVGAMKDRSSPVPGSKAAEERALLASVASGAAFKLPGEGPGKQVQKMEKHKKKVFKLPPVRLRRTVAPPNPQLLCIRTPNVDLTHEQVKSMLEAQLGTITSLQYDPEYIQNGDVHLAPRAMWIFRMEDITDSNYEKIMMAGIIGYDGENLRIRRRDDVHNEENRAFLLVKQIKDEQVNRKNKIKPGKLKPTPSA